MTDPTIEQQEEPMHLSTRMITLAALLISACADPTLPDGSFAQEGTIADQSLHQLGVAIEDAMAPEPVNVDGKTFDGFAVEYMEPGATIPLTRFLFTALRTELVSPSAADRAESARPVVGPPTAATVSGVEIDIRIAGSGDPIAQGQPVDLHGPGPHPGDMQGLALYFRDQDRWDAVGGSFTLIESDFGGEPIACALDATSGPGTCEAWLGTVHGVFAFDVEATPGEFETHGASFEMPAYRIVVSR